MDAMEVWADGYGGYALVGRIVADGGHASFGYDRGYRGPAISCRLPLRQGPFGENETETFFSALVPEGRTRLDFLQALRAGRGEYLPLLRSLNDESCGALVFGIEGQPPGSDETYELVGEGLLDELAARPFETSERIMGRARLSLAGAMSKVGLYHDETTGGWHYALGAAPTTHIVKAADDALFPHEVVNEALCLETARLCDLPVEKFELIGTATSPLLAVTRFDRAMPDEPRLVSGLPRPRRRHQEDFCQAGGTRLKYEPDGADFLSFAIRQARCFCGNAFGEAMMVLYATFYSYLMGNCDNHLKNLSLLYSEDWRDREVSPLYDIVDTTVYEKVKETMGIPLSRSRSIFDVTRESIEARVVGAGMPPDIAMREYDALAEMVPECFERACGNLAHLGFGDDVDALHDAMAMGIEHRRSFVFSERNRIAIDSPKIGSWPRFS